MPAPKSLQIVLENSSYYAMIRCMGLRKLPPHTYIKTINGSEYLYARKQIKGVIHQEELGRVDKLNTYSALKKRDEFLSKITNGESHSKVDQPVFKSESTLEIDSFPNPTLNEFSSELDKIYGDLGTLDQYKRHFKSFIDFCQNECKLSDIKLHKITRMNASAFFNFRRDSKVNGDNKLANKTLLNIKRSLVAVYNKAISNGYISHELHNPFAHYEIKNNKLRERTATVDEEQRLYSNAKEWVVPVFITAFNTGLRVDNLLRLKWADVKWDSKSFYLLHAKINKYRYIPWNTNMQKLMIILQQMSGHNEYLFLNNFGKPYHKKGIKNSAKNAFASTFKTTIKNAQVADFTFHDIRRTVKTRLASKGVSSDHSDHLLGHTYEGARKYYIFISEEHIEDLRLSMEKLLYYNCDFLNNYLGIAPISKRSCESCKLEYDEESNFCGRCGNKLT